MEVTYFTGHAVFRCIGGVTLIRAFVMELENRAGDAKGKGTSGGPTRPKVPMPLARGALLRSNGEAG
jgi:hypothetical protein